LAATLAEGVTVIESAACEPEVVDLANFLKRNGREKSPAPAARRLRLPAFKKLHGAEHQVIPTGLKRRLLPLPPPRRTAK